MTRYFSLPRGSVREFAEHGIFAGDAGLTRLLVMGVALRVIVHVFLGPSNNDDHYAVVRYIFEHRAIPASDSLAEAFQPPLYYVLAAPWIRLGGPKAVQFFSLALSQGTIFVYYRLIRRSEFIGSQEQRLAALFLVAFLPQFVMYSAYVSNDALAIFIGSLVFFLMDLCLRSTRTGPVCILGACLGLGMLTKGSFLAFTPGLVLFVVGRERLNGSGAWKTFNIAALFLLLALAIGCYKYVDNALEFGTPTYSNLDAYDTGGWPAKQRPTYEGPISFLDANVLDLMANPTVSPATHHSYPLMLYGSFWYQYVPESTFKGNLTRLRYLGSAIDLVALVPTTVMLLGFIAFAAPVLTSRLRGPGATPGATLFGGTAVLILLTNLALIFTVGLRYDVWSLFQARLLFPSFFGFIVLLCAGLGLVEDRPLGRSVARGSFLLLFILFVLYFATEIGYCLLQVTGLLPEIHGPFRH